MHLRHFILLVLSFAVADAQYSEEETGYWRHPTMTASGILTTDNAGSTLYRVAGLTAQPLVRSRGIGNGFVISPDGRRVGCKLIDDGGLQRPAVLDAATGILRPLTEPQERAGQPSFASDGTIAYTIGTDLIVERPTGTIRTSLGFYANRAPISPDGTAAAFNDGDDRIWIVDLADGRRTPVSPDGIGCFDPQWSPDGTRLLFTSLGSDGYVYERESSRLSALGEARSPSWMSDSRTVVFHRVEMRGPVPVNADLYAIRADGTQLARLTETPDEFEMDAKEDRTSGTLVYHTYGRHEIASRRILRDATGAMRLALSASLVVTNAPTPFAEPMAAPLAKEAGRTTLDIPYVHQTYDTPEWHNGNGSCAPTAAMMVIAYYRILPPWPTYCSTPSVHYNDWGGYVADKFQFRGVNYANFQTTDYGGNITWGAYGYMWIYGSPHTKMANFYRACGMTATQTESTPHSTALADIQAGYPFTMCVMLTSAGHLIIAHGVGAEEHTFVFNDPYGDKNRGYKNYYGKNVQYDWPGYNNGFQNLAGVAWCIGTRFTPPGQADTLVDDLQIGRGFYMHTSTPASMTLWKDQIQGYDAHSWWLTTTVMDGCYATWTPNLPQAATYEISVYVPANATATARYVVTYSGGKDTVAVDQSGHADSWVSLGTYACDAGTSVRLGSGAVTTGQRLGVDAVRWSALVTAVPRDRGLPTAFTLRPNVPNPFNPSTRLEYDVPARAAIRLEVVDLLGRTIAVLAEGEEEPGVHSVVWNAGAHASGIYIAALTARLPSGRLLRFAQKMVLMR